MKIMFIMKKTKEIESQCYLLEPCSRLKRDPCVNCALNHAGDHFVRVYIEVG